MRSQKYALEKIITNKKEDFLPQFLKNCGCKKVVLYGQQLGKRPRSAASLNVNKVTESVFEEADVVSKKQKRGLRG